jgi:hypothetical protein
MRKGRAKEEGRSISIFFSLLFCLHISGVACQAVVVGYPILDVIRYVTSALRANVYGFYSRIDYMTLTHRARAGIQYLFACFGIEASEIEICADHRLTTRADDRIHFGMNGTAKLISFTTRYLHRFSYTIVEVGTIFSSSRRAIIARCDYFIVFNDYCTVAFTKASASLRDGQRDIEVVVYFTFSFHIRPPFFRFDGT